MYQITKDFLAYIGKDLAVKDAPSNQNLWMNCQKAREQGVIFSSVEDGLKRCATDYGVAFCT